jgi:toxin ParE1/3/4
MKVIWAKSALSDMLEIQAYLEEHSPPAAWKVINKIADAAEALAQLPKRGKAGRAENTREYVMQDFPYIIVYKVDDATVGIARVLHTSRLWPHE